MALIKTEVDLTTYILNMLGEPIITVEVSPTQISNAIQFAIQKFTDFAMGGETPTAYVLDLLSGVNSYVMDDRVQAITKVRTIGSSFSFSMAGMILTPSEICAAAAGGMAGHVDLTSMYSVMADISVLDKFFDIEPNWNYNGNTKVLTFLDTTANISKYATIEAYVSYVPASVDNIYNHQWIKEYSIALTKKQWGNNIGKLNTTLINGATLNYERILQEANTEIDKLEADLLTKWCSPLGIIRG